jgi:hypothetical protein
VVRPDVASYLLGKANDGYLFNGCSGLKKISIGCTMERNENV